MPSRCKPGANPERAAARGLNPAAREKIGMRFARDPIAPAVHRSSYYTDEAGTRPKRGSAPAFRPWLPAATRAITSQVGLRAREWTFPPNRLPALASAVASWFSSTHLPLRGQRRSWFMRKTVPDFPFHPPAVFGRRTPGRGRKFDADHLPFQIRPARSTIELEPLPG